MRALFADTATAVQASASAADHMAGPLAAETAANARKSDVCAWSVPASHGGFSVVSAELTTTARDRLVSSLGSTSSYRSTTIGGATAFTSSEEGEFGTIATVYAFTGTVWITVTGTLTVDTAREFASSALSAVRAANR